jgi:multidrug transporter EmrE-like cation transporter
MMLLLALFIAGGVGVALNNQINLYLSGVVASAVFFPIVNGGGLILITAASVVLFREKLTARQWLGLALGIVATLLLCI